MMPAVHDHVTPLILLEETAHFCSKKWRDTSKGLPSSCTFLADGVRCVRLRQIGCICHLQSDHTMHNTGPNLLHMMRAYAGLAPAQVLHQSGTVLTFMMRCSALPLRSDRRTVEACAMTWPPTCSVEIHKVD